MRCLILTALVASSIALQSCGGQGQSAPRDGTPSTGAAVPRDQGPASEARAKSRRDVGRAWRRTLDVDRRDAATAVAAQPDGKLLVAGETHVSGDKQATWVLARYRRDGTLDPEFGVDGTVVTDYGGDESGVKDILVQGDGRILAVGDWGRTFASLPTEASAIAVARFLADGSPDASFGDGGRAVIRDLDHARELDCLSPSAAALQPDGGVVVAGTVGCGGEAGSMWATVMRLDPAGRLDRSFGGDGSRSFGFGHCASGSAVAVQADGRIVVGGGDGGCYENRSPFRVARFHPNGSFDRSFGRRGRAAVRFEAPVSNLRDLAIDREGRIVLAGNSGTPATFSRRRARWALAVARLRANGRPDDRFGVHGRRATRSSDARGSLIAEAVTLLPGGRIVLAGSSTSPLDGSRLLVAQYQPGGRPDRSFGPRGLRHPRLGREAAAHDVTTDAAGAIVTVGSARRSNADFAVARLHP
jgi:uncharacterized delta-60 repeat protein